MPFISIFLFLLFIYILMIPSGPLHDKCKKYYTRKQWGTNKVHCYLCDIDFEVKE